MSAVCNLLFISSFYSMSHKGYSHSHLRYLICVLSIAFLAIFLSGSKYEIGSDTKLCSLSKLSVLNVVLECMFVLNIWGTVSTCFTKTGIAKFPSYELYVPSTLPVSDAEFCICVFRIILSVNRNHFLKTAPIN
jgi:hypothetical protein